MCQEPRGEKKGNCLQFMGIVAALTVAMDVGRAIKASPKRRHKGAFLTHRLKTYDFASATTLPFLSPSLAPPTFLAFYVCYCYLSSISTKDRIPVRKEMEEGAVSETYRPLLEMRTLQFAPDPCALELGSCRPELSGYPPKPLGAATDGLLNAMQDFAKVAL